MPAVWFMQRYQEAGASYNVTVESEEEDTSDDEKRIVQNDQLEKGQGAAAATGEEHTGEQVCVC